MNDTETLSIQFQALADPIRLRILRLIHSGAPSATDLNQAMGMSQPRIAHHLKILVTAGIVISERDGRFVRYHAPDKGLERSLFDIAVGSTEPPAASPPRQANDPEVRAHDLGTPGSSRVEGVEDTERETGGELEDFLL